MTIIAEVSWDQFADGRFPQSESPVRQAFRQAVEHVAQKAREVLPESNGRIDKAVHLVLAGDVTLLENGQKARVASQANGTKAYFVVNGTCECRDFANAPNGFCKHRLAFGIYKRASAFAKQRLEQLDAASNVTTTADPEHVETEVPVATPALPEAPASCNVYVTIGGRNVQVTLRDQDEQHMLTRLASLLQRFPVVEEPKEQAQQEGWCSKHNVQMKLNRGKKGSWWSHKTPDGQWCNKK